MGKREPKQGQKRGEPNHDCLSDEPVEATQNWARWHRQRGETPCPRSKEAHSLREKQRRPKKPNHDCYATGPVKATRAWKEYHQRLGQDPCGRSLEAYEAYYKPLRKGYKGPQCPTHRAYVEHLRRGERCEECLDAAAARARKVRKRKTPARWMVYVVRFANGFWYYGSARTWMTKKISALRNSDARVGRMFKSGETYKAEVLAWCDTKEQALQMEARFILASDRSKLLNEVIPYGRPG